MEGNDPEFGAHEDSDVQFNCLNSSPLSTLNTPSLRDLGLPCLYTDGKTALKHFSFFGVPMPTLAPPSGKC